MAVYFSPQGIFSFFFPEGKMKHTDTSYLAQVIEPEGITFESSNTESGFTIKKTIQVNAYHKFSEGVHHLYLKVISLSKAFERDQAFTLTAVHFERAAHSSTIKVTRVIQNLFNPKDDRPIESEEYDNLYRSSHYSPDMYGKAKITKSPFDLSSYKLNKGFETVFEGAEHLIPASKDQP